MAPARTLSSKRRARRRGLLISYAHQDAKWLEYFQTMLSPLVQEEGIDVWDDTRIAAGSAWRMEIQRAINTARVALLLVSPSYLASKFIAEEELPPLLRAARKEGMIILWVLVSPCMYKKTAIAEFQPAHSVDRALELVAAARRNQKILEIADVIDAVLHEQRPTRRRA
jgi:hypothetical protein